MFFQISTKVDIKTAEDVDKVMVLVNDKLFIIEESIKEEMLEEVLEEIFEGTPVLVKTQPTRAGGQFSLADYLEVKGKIPIKINNKSANLITNPVLSNSRVLLPIRTIAKELESDVEWDSKKREVTITKDNKVIKIASNDDIVKVNDKKYLISNKTKINENRLLSVIKLIVTELDAEMKWDTKNNILLINSFKNTQEKNLDKDFR